MTIQSLDTLCAGAILQEAEMSALEAERREREHQRGKTPSSRWGRSRSAEAEAEDDDDAALVGKLAMLQKRVRQFVRGKACEWARSAMPSVGLSIGSGDEGKERERKGCYRGKGTAGWGLADC